MARFILFGFVHQSLRIVVNRRLHGTRHDTGHGPRQTDQPANAGRHVGKSVTSIRCGIGNDPDHWLHGESGDGAPSATQRRFDGNCRNRGSGIGC